MLTNHWTHKNIRQIVKQFGVWHKRCTLFKLVGRTLHRRVQTSKQQRLDIYTVIVEKLIETTLIEGSYAKTSLPKPFVHLLLLIIICAYQ
jgi:hypothetical protein